MFNMFFFFNDTATTEIYTLSLHDALPIPLGRERLRSLQPLVALPAGPLGPGIRRPPVAESLAQGAQPLARVRDQRNRTVFAGVERLHVEGQYPAALRVKQRRRAGREVLKARADREHHVRIRAE